MNFEAFWNTYFIEFKDVIPYLQKKCKEILEKLYLARYLNDPINLSETDKKFMERGSDFSIEKWIELIDEYVRLEKADDIEDYYKPLRERMSFEQFKSEVMKDVDSDLTLDDILHMLYGDKKMPDSLASVIYRFAVPVA